MVYKFRVILDAEEDVFRDIAILAEDTLEDFHNAIFNSFGFDGLEVASFYTCDDTWNQEDEIPMFDAGDVPGEQKTMSDYQLSDLLDQQNTKIIYVYDFINMWTFLVFDVNQFARDHFSGGGHINAAGGKSDLSLQETINKFEELITQNINLNETN